MEVALHKIHSVVEMHKLSARWQGCDGPVPGSPLTENILGVDFGKGFVGCEGNEMWVVVRRSNQKGGGWINGRAALWYGCSMDRTYWLQLL